VSSSVCENNRPFESARTVTRPDMRMRNAAPSSSACRPSRKLFPRVPRAGNLPHDNGGWFRDIAWDVLIIDEEPMPWYAPVISPEGNVVHAFYLSMLMIQPLLADVLAMGRAGWSRAHCELEERNSWKLSRGALVSRRRWEARICPAMGKRKESIQDI
jgi:hypothetical protein